MSMQKAVIFDYDDTLVASSEALYGADSKTATLLGLAPASREEYFRVRGRPHEEMIMKLYPGIGFGRYLETYKTVYDPSGVRLVEGAREVLAELSASGVMLAVLSAKSSAFLEEHLRLNGIRDYFAYIHSAETSRYTKPNPRVFDDVLEHLGIAPYDAVYVGDMVIDCVAASAAHMGFVGVASGIDTVKKFHDGGAGMSLTAWRS